MDSEAPPQRGRMLPRAQRSRALRGPGVLVWATTPCGDVVFLLGREGVVPGWRSGSERWGTFSGRILHAHESSLSCAAREFVEETLGMVPLHPGPLPVSTQAAQDALVRLPPEAALEYVVSTRAGPCAHVHYIHRVPYADYEAAFQEARRSLLRLLGHLKDHRGAQLRLHRYPGSLLLGHAPCRHLTVVRLALRGSRCEVTLYDTRRNETARQDVAVPPGEAAAVAEYVSAWNTVVAAHAALPVPLRQHPALQPTRVGPYLTDLAVHRDHLEKTELRWWALSHLIQLGHNEQLHGFFQVLLPLFAARLQVLRDAPPHMIICARPARGAPAGAPPGAVAGRGTGADVEGASAPSAAASFPEKVGASI